MTTIDYKKNMKNTKINMKNIIVNSGQDIILIKN